MKLTISIPVPADENQSNLQAWENPRKWQEKEIEVNDKLIFMACEKWGDSVGMHLHFWSENESKYYSHFVRGYVIINTKI